MAVTVRGASAFGGPRNGTSWTSPIEGAEPLVSYPLNAAQSVAVNGTSEQPIFVVPLVSTWTPDGAQRDALSADNVIATLNSVYLATMGVALIVTLAATTFSFFLRRAGAVVGGGAFAGWAAASNPALAAFSTVRVPFLPANTALVAPPGQPAVTATAALLPLQPGDMVTFSVATGGATTIPFLVAAVDAS
jgi:hypothetical protein